MEGPQKAPSMASSANSRNASDGRKKALRNGLTYLKILSRQRQAMPHQRYLTAAPPLLFALCESWHQAALPPQIEQLLEAEERQARRGRNGLPESSTPATGKLPP